MPRSRRHLLACAVLAAVAAGAAGACAARLYQAPSSTPGFGADSDWAHYLGHRGGTQYSRLNHINKDKREHLILRCGWARMVPAPSRSTADR